VASSATTASNTGEVTYEMVLKRLNSAANEDALSVACDWINSLTDNEQVKQLHARYDERLAEMRG
jgi:hypothetical protein